MDQRKLFHRITTYVKRQTLKGELEMRFYTFSEGWNARLEH